MDHDHTHVWQEDPAYADNYRQAYARGIDAFVSRLNLEAQSSRRIPMTTEVQEQKRKLYKKCWVWTCSPKAPPNRRT